MKTFIFGADDLPKTPQELARMRAMAEALAPSRAPQNVGEGIASIGNAILYRALMKKADGAEAAGKEKANKAFSALMAPSQFPPAPGSSTGGSAAQSATPAVDTTAPEGSTFEPFISTVKAGGVTNPYALGAIAATGKAESGWSPKNANRTWGDPSVSGAAGTAGGIMSWRNERLNNLISFATAKGERPGAISPQTQAEFFLQEDPSLIAKLNQAKSPEEAADIMAGAWRFAGYDQQGGEAGRRRQLAQAYASQFAGNGEQPAGIAAQPGMAATASPALGYVDPMVSAPNAQPRSEPQQQTQAAPPLPPPVEVADASDGLPDWMKSPQMRSANPNVGVLRALTGGGSGAGTVQPSIDMNQAIQLLNDPYMDEGKKAVLQSLIAKEQKRQDMLIEQQSPKYQIDLRKSQLELDNLEHPKIGPADQARLDLDREKMRQEQENRNTLTAAEKANQDLERQKFDYEREDGALTPDLKEYAAYAKGEIAAGRKPLGQLEYQIAVKRAGANSTTVNTGETDKFYQKMDEKNAETFSNLSDGGIQARSKMGQIDRLEQLMANAPQGAVGALKQAAGEWGLPTEGLSDIQAASSLLERMVPEQRAPGSGPMSDADIKMYRASLPRLLNQPGGNQLIFQTMRGIAQYEMQMGDIADKVANREITPAEGRRMIKELRNPLADFKPPAAGPTPNEGWQEAPGVPGVKIRLKGSQ